MAPPFFFFFFQLQQWVCPTQVFFLKGIFHSFRTIVRIVRILNEGRAGETDFWLGLPTRRLPKPVHVLSKNPDSLAFGLVLLAYSIGLVQTVRGGASYLLCLRISKPWDRHSLYIKTPIFRFPHLPRTLLNLRENISFFNYLPNCFVIIVFLSIGTETSPLVQIHPSQPPASSCASRPHFYRLSLHT